MSLLFLSFLFDFFRSGRRQRVEDDVDLEEANPDADPDGSANDETAIDNDNDQPSEQEENGRQQPTTATAPSKSRFRSGTIFSTFTTGSNDDTPRRSWTAWLGLSSNNGSSTTPPRRRVRLGRSLTTFSTSSASTYISSQELPTEHPFIPPFVRKAKEFIFHPPPPKDAVTFIPNYRWTPILSGILIPFSILLEIPGLTGHWYIRTEADRTVEVQPNPQWLDAVIGLSMASAVVANLALIRRFSEHNPKEMTILAIVMLTIHDIINLSATTIFAVQRRFNDGFTYGQPFWMTVGSTVISLFTNVTLIFDYVRTPEFSKSGSGLTRKQRSLVVIVIILLCWIALGAIVYSVLMGLSFIDGLYFTVVSIETIGFGDFHPTDTRSRVFAIFYNTIGILNLGMAISTCRETIIESFEHGYRKRLRKMAIRRSHKRERRFRKLCVERALKKANLPVYINVELKHNRGQNGHSGKLPANSHHRVATLGGGGGGRTSYRKRTKHILNEKALSPDEMRQVMEEVDEMLHHAHVNDELSGASNSPEMSEKMNIRDLQDEVNGYVGTIKLLDAFGHNASSAAYREQRREFIIKLSTAWVLFLLFWLIGGVIFMNTEKWSYGSSLYFCFITFSTIGYGELAPTSPAGRSIFVVWALMGVGTMTILISVLAEAYSSKYHQVLHNHHFRQAIKIFRHHETAGAHHKIGIEPSLAGSHDNLVEEKSIDIPVTPILELPNGNSHGQATPSQNNNNNSTTTTTTHDVHLDEVLSHDPYVAQHKTEFLQIAHALQTHAWYFLSSTGSYGLSRPPQSLLDFLDEVGTAGNICTSGPNGEVGKLDIKIKKDIMSDDDSRRLLFMANLEDSVRKMFACLEHISPSPLTLLKLPSTHSLNDVNGLGVHNALPSSQQPSNDNPIIYSEPENTESLDVA